MIYLKILKKYISYVFKVLKCLNIKNLHLKLKKCEFHQKEINFLEFINYNKKFIKNYLANTILLTNFTKKNTS